MSSLTVDQIRQLREELQETMRKQIALFERNTQTKIRQIDTIREAAQGETGIVETLVGVELTLQIAM